MGASGRSPRGRGRGAGVVIRPGEGGCHGSDGKVPDSAVMTTRAGSILVMDYS
jgi:hypothetical protein